MDRATLKKLLIAHKEGSIDAEGYELLNNYVHSTSEDNTEMLLSVLSELMYEQKEDITIPVSSEDMYAQITSDVRFRRKSKTTLYYFRAASIVAAILVILGSTWFLEKITNPTMKASTERLRMTTGAPTDRLVLKTGDGTTYDIDKLSKSTAIHANQDIFSIDEDQITYDGNPSLNKVAGITHTLATPKGRQFKLVLSDGTKVWLNAATILKFPASFAPNERVVEVDGEAYFEVEKAKDWPFVVRTSRQNIKVLGTHFNVLAYNEDRTSSTTLIEGIVKVSNANGEMTLHPGQQAISSEHHDDMLIQSVTAEDAIAWKDQLFVFQDEEIQEVMRQISRWYNVSVEYLDGMEGKHIAGSVPRYENIGELMEALAATGLLNYKIKGGAVIISK